MLAEEQILEKSERYVINREAVDQVALPLGDHYEDDLFQAYFADYAGMAKKYKPKRILEIGVRYGYTGIVFMLGLKANPGQPKAEYIGIDDESYHFGSCAQANVNFAHALPGYKMQAIKHNSFSGLPNEIGMFSLIHIDGNHTYQGVMSDLKNVWPVLNQGGIVMVDDAARTDDRGQPGEIYLAVTDYLSQFKHVDDRVLWQYQENQRGHVYIKKCE